MRKIDIQDLIQLLGMVGIIGSLIFVGLEMRQSQIVSIAGQTQARNQAIMDFQLDIACPEGFEPTSIDANNCKLAENPYDAVDGADLVVTDVWASMGMEAEYEERLKKFMPYQVNEAMMAKVAEARAQRRQRGVPLRAQLRRGQAAQLLQMLLRLRRARQSAAAAP